MLTAGGDGDGNAHGSLLAEVLRQCAAEEGSMARLARAAGISRQTLHELVAGKRGPGRHVARAVAAYLSGRSAEHGCITAETVAEWACEATAPSEI